MLGYNISLHPMLAELNEYVAPGSSVTVVVDVSPPAFRSYENLTVTFTEGDPTSRAVLERLKVQEFEHIIVLADKDNLETHRADAKTLITLFSSDGSEIYLRQADEYVQAGSSVDFYTVLEAARQRGETAIGYRIAEHAHNKQQAYGVTVNPRKAEKRIFAPGDKIIVLAEA